MAGDEIAFIAATQCTLEYLCSVYCILYLLARPQVLWNYLFLGRATRLNYSIMHQFNVL